MNTITQMLPKPTTLFPSGLVRLEWKVINFSNKYTYTPRKRSCLRMQVNLTLICWRLFLWRSCWRWWVKLPLRSIWASRLCRNKIPTATPMFSESNFPMVLSVTLPDETGSQKSKMAAEILYLHISQLHDSDTISTAITRFQCHKTRNKNNDFVRCLGMS